MTDNARTVANKQARDERKRAYLVAMMGRYTAEFLAAGNQDAPAVARSTHATIDNVLERDRKRSPASGAINCHRGCNHCCHGPVEISPHEAALLVHVARDTGITMDRE